MKKSLLLLLSLILLGGCNQTNINNKDDGDGGIVEPTGPTDPSDPSDPTNPSDPEDPSDPSDPTTPTEPEDDEITNKVKLDCGYYQMDLPKNKTPYNLVTTLSSDSETWSNNEMYDSLPSDFRFIYGNSSDDGESGSVAKPKFYSYNSSLPTKYPGGLKFDQVSKGFQSQLFSHTGNKLEIRLGISQVNNASDKPEKDKDTLRIYYFNNKGNYLGQHNVVAETLTTSTKEIKYYETSSFTKDIAYFEVRLTAMAYKGSQCYNFGMNYCNFKSWERI